MSVVRFEGDADFPLKGGSLGYFRDRKAAVFVYARRLHSISLLVFRADGLPWPSRGLTRINGVEASVAAEVRVRPAGSTEAIDALVMPKALPPIGTSR